MRYYVAHKNVYPKSINVTNLLNNEKLLGIDSLKKLKKFKYSVEMSKKKLIDLLVKLKNKNKSICGYAATSKSTTILNYCDINNYYIDYICDTTPLKHNKFSPGKHIPIKTDKYFRNNYPDYAILFAWNHAKEIFKKEKEFVRRGGKWIMFIPSVKIIND